jgi:hypothetical protein
MLAARTIGGLLTLVAAVLVGVGTRASPGADAPRQASLRRAARRVGVFHGVWLLRDGAELMLTREAWTFAHRVDLACVVAGALLALVAIGAGSGPEAWMAEERDARRVRAVLFGAAALAGTAAIARLLV